jgi:hypothetical protein
MTNASSTSRLVFMLAVSLYLVSAQSLPKSSGVGLDLARLQTQRFCYGDAETYSQLLDFDAVYTNRGTFGLRLYLGNEVPVGMVVAKTADDLKNRRLETEQHWTVYPAPGGRSMVGVDPKNERSVDLKPGESTVSRSSAALVVRSVPYNIPGTLAPGGHFFQVQMLLKVSRAVSSPVRGKQQQSSQFQWLTIQSGPVQIDVPRGPQIDQCRPN